MTASNSLHAGFRPRAVLQRLGSLLACLMGPVSAADPVALESGPVAVDTLPYVRVNGIDQDVGGRFAPPVTVQLLPRFADGAVHFTLDGSEPTPQSPKYTQPLVLQQSAVLRQISVRAGGAEIAPVPSVSFEVVFDSTPFSVGVASSPIAVDTFPLARVTGNEVNGPLRIREGTAVELVSRFPAGTVFYTLDGSLPTLASPRYEKPLPLTQSAQLRQLAVSADGRETTLVRVLDLQVVGDDRPFVASGESGVVHLDTYPPLIVNGQEIDQSVRVGDRATLQLVSRFPGGQIFYTLDGSEPSLGSTRYSGPVAVERSVIVRQLGISEDFTETATVWPVGVEVVPTYRLATATTGPGRITRDPALDRYLQDDVVLVRAVPNAGARFVRWEEDLSGAFPERNVAMGRDRSIRAVFESIPRFPLEVAAAGGTVTGGGLQFEGATVDLLATPLAGWSFLGWTGDHVGVETNFSWVVEGPARFVARFGTPITTVATGGGRIALEPDLPVYPHGTVVKVLPIPNPGQSLVLWGGTGAGQPKGEWLLTVTNAQPRVTALFQALAPDRVVLTVQSTLGGRVQQPNAEGLYAKGTEVTLTAIPETGYEFSGWTGDVTGTAAQVTLRLDASRTVRAEFRRAGVVSHPLTVTVDGPGVVRRIPDQGAYEIGSEVELVAEPKGDAVLGGWTGAVMGAARRVRVTITGPTVVGARFLTLHPVATEVRGEGQVLLSPPEARYAEGTVISLTAKPAEGWGFVQWSGDLVTTAQEAGLTIDAPKRVVAEFARLGTLTTRVLGQGTIGRSPDAPSYLPGTVVTLRAQAAAGWRFARWSGGATGTNAEVAVVVGRTEAIVAAFVDGEPPVLGVLEPGAGTVTEGRFRLKGTVSDNVGVGSVGWTWNGSPQPELIVREGGFESAALELKVGLNRLEVTARDTTGNESRVVREVTWTPVRLLEVGTATEVQEGQRLVYPVRLVAPGDVGGMTFQLRYDPVLLADPQFEWGALVGQSVNNVNLSTPGEMGLAFSLAGLALPSGTNPVATVSFRARSVPGVTQAVLTPTIVSLGTPSGAALKDGNAAVSGGGRILPRKIRGDNNANQRIDVGDAVVISRLQVGLEEARPWDVPLNDLNDSGTIDNGDVIRALRIVVGLDLQPKAAPRGSEWSVERGALRGEGAAGAGGAPGPYIGQEGVGPGVGWALSRPVPQSTAAPTDLRPVASGREGLRPAGGSDNPEGVGGTGGASDSVSQLSTLNTQLNARRLRPAGSNTNDVAILEFPDGPVAQVAKPYRVVVKLTRASAAIAGLSFTVNYPSVLTLSDRQVGALVPADALPLWAESVGRLNLAAVRSTLWPTSTGVAAVLTFLPTAGIHAQATWPIELVTGEVTGVGFDIRGVDNVVGQIRSASTPPTEPKVVVPTLPSDGGPLALDIEAAAGAAIVLETTTDLSAWSESQRLTGQGAGKPVRVTVTPDPDARVRFWRVRVP